MLELGKASGAHEAGCLAFGAGIAIGSVEHAFFIIFASSWPVSEQVAFYGANPTDFKVNNSDLTIYWSHLLINAIFLSFGILSLRLRRH